MLGQGSLAGRKRLHGLASLSLRLSACLVLLLLTASSFAYLARRHGLVRDSRVLASDRYAPIDNVVFFNDPEVVSRLGCPRPDGQVAREHDFKCFYRFTSFGRTIDDAKTASRFEPEKDCWAVRKPIPDDMGSPWCIRSGKKPAWLSKAVPGEWPVQPGMTLLMGELSGPNPTHSLSVHYIHIYRWMRKMGIPLGELNLMYDSVSEAWTPGRYGRGLSDALGHYKGLLKDAPRVLVLEQLKFSIGGGFPFDLGATQTITPVMCDYLHMAAHIRQHYNLPPVQEANPRRVVLAVRKPIDSRVLANGPEVAEALAAVGFEVAMVVLGDMTFAQQLEVVADAKVLVGVHGSDLVNMLFMPFRAAFVEILPLVRGTPLWNPELANQARNYGVTHFPYYSPHNATLVIDTATGQPLEARPVHQAKLVRVDVPDLVAVVQAIIPVADSARFDGLVVHPASPHDIGSVVDPLVCHYDHPLPRDLYNDGFGGPYQ